MTAARAENTSEIAGKGLALPGLVVGLLAGLAAWGVIDHWISVSQTGNPLAMTVLLFIPTAAASYLLLAERGAFARAALGALAIAGFFALPDYFIANAVGHEPDNLTPFPAMFWAASRMLGAYLLVTLMKAGFESGFPPAYERVFFHGVTLPLIGGGAALFSGLAVLLLLAWALLLKELNVALFDALFQKRWFMLPFLGAITGLSIALMRGQDAVLGALRYVLLLLARILIVITAIFTLTLLIVLAANGAGPIFEQPFPGAIMMGLALLGMLIFNGVYQNGAGTPPPLWLRLPTLIALIGFPVYAGLALTAFYLRIDAYGLTPPRIAGLAVSGLIALYSLVCLAGLVTEINWRGKTWMPLVGRLNTVMAALWVLVLTALATPLFNPWAMSAGSQYRLLASEKIAAEDFDFGYLRFQLGADGEKALEKLLTLEHHSEAAAIRDGVMRARAANSYWEYKNPEAASGSLETERKPQAQPDADSPELLPLNPQGADTGEDDPD